MDNKNKQYQIVDKCLVCNQSKFKIMHRHNQIYFCKCDNCGLLFVNQIPYNNEPHDIKEDNFFKYNCAGAKNIYEIQLINARHKIQLRIDFLMRLTNKNIKNVLEIGAGLGVWSKAFQEIGIKYLGIDMDRNAVEAGKRFGANLVQGDFLSENLSFVMTDKFDIIIAFQVFEHIFKPHRFLEKVSTFLKKDGVFYFDIPNPAGLIPTLKKIPFLSFKYDNEYCFLKPPLHYLSYSDHTIKYILKLHNYELLHISHPGFSHPILGQMGNYGLLNKMASILMTAFNRGSLTAIVCKKNA